MTNGSNPNRIAAAQKLRDEYADPIRQMCAAGRTIGEMRKAIGKSHAFVRRVMDENGLKLATEIEGPKEPVHTGDTDRITIVVDHDKYHQHKNRISLARMPWQSEYQPDPRDETKPRAPSHMFSSAPGPYEGFVAALREVAA